MTEPDEALLYAREQMADDLLQNGGSAEDVAAARAGAFDTLLKVAAAFYRAGARMAREQERERAKVLLRGLEDIVDADQDEISHMARAILAKYRGEA